MSGLSPAAARVRDAANDRIAEIAARYLGPPKPGGRRGRMRFPGAVEVTTRGRHAGQWRAWPSGEHGDGLALIRHATGCSFAEALAVAAEFFGLPLDDAPLTAEQRRRHRDEAARRRRQHAAADAYDRLRRLDKAQAIWEASIPIAACSLADRYLTETRGIPRPAAGWPSDVMRYHAASRAVVFAATDDAGELRAVHRVFLTGDARNRTRPNGTKIKITNGIMAGAVVRLPSTAGLAAPLLRAEGAETGLSGWRATGHATWICLGGIARVTPPAGRRVIDLRDDDPVGGPADRAYETALAGWRNVTPAMPWQDRRGDKTDFNDVIRQHSLDEVRARIRLAELASDGLAPAAAPFPLPTATRSQIHTAIGHALTDFLTRRWEDTPPRLLVTAVPGAGKSEHIGRRLPHQIIVDKAKRRPHRVVVLAETHHLGGQLAERYRTMIAEAGLTDRITVATYQGRGDPWADPWDNPDRDSPCVNLREVGLAIRAGADIAATVCGQPGSEARCPYRDGCAYFGQMDAAAEADILIVAHNFLFQSLPKRLLNDIGYVVIEEDPSAHAGATVTLPIDIFGNDALFQHPVLHTGEDERGQPDYPATARLDELFRKLDAVVAAIAVDTAAAKAMQAAGLTARDCTEARKLNWKRRIDDGMTPGMAIAERMARAEACSFNLILPKIASALHALEEIARLPNPQLFGDSLSTKVDERIWVERGELVVPGLREPAHWLAERPILIASATARHDLLSKVFPGLEHLMPPAPALPHQRVHQHLGSFGKARGITGKLDDLVAEVRLAIMGGKSALVIMHKQHEAAFRGLPGVTVRHHGSIAGDDDFGSTDIVFQFGAPFARPSQIARQASAEARRRVAIDKPVRTPCIALMEDGTGAQFDRLAYPDPAAQAAHASIYDVAFQQGGLGRGRGINRTAATPLAIHIYGNVDLPVPLALLDRWRRPSRVARMFLAGAVHENAADMARFHADLFPSHAAAGKAVERWGGTAAMRDEVRRLAGEAGIAVDAVTWQPAGQGHKPRRSMIAHGGLAVFRAAIKREFPGGLVLWKVAPLTAKSRWEEYDSGGNTDQLQVVSNSSPVVEQMLPRSPDAPPRWTGPAPPDG